MGLLTKKGEERALDQIENLLGRSVTVHGDLKAEGAFRIDGTIEGSIESATAIVIGESGVVRGDLRARDIVIAGQVTGNVVCSNHLEIVATGKIEGDIQAKSVPVETGGVFCGTSRMGGDESSAPKRLASVQ